MPIKDVEGSYVIENQDQDWSEDQYQEFGGLYQAPIGDPIDSENILGGIKKMVARTEADLLIRKDSQKQTFKLRSRASIGSTIAEDFQFVGDDHNQVIWTLEEDRIHLIAKPIPPAQIFPDDLAVTASYPIADRPAPGVFARLILHLTPDTEQSEHIQLQFQARKLTWRFS